MRFISIPQNGSSWRGRLPYCFTTERSEPSDVVVEIVNATSSERLGTMRLYGVTEAEVDIASYIRPHLSLTPIESERQPMLITSPSAIAVVVRVNGEESERRVFFRSKFDATTPAILSNCPTVQNLIFGDAIRLTLYACSDISVVIAVRSPKGTTMKATGVSNGMPMELVMPTQRLFGAEMIMLTIRLDGGEAYRRDYVLVSNAASARNVLWYNAVGGIDNYIFDHHKRLNYSVDRAEVHICKEEAKSAEGLLRYRLCSGYELEAEMERVVQLLLSPVVYAEVDGYCRDVEVESRNVSFDSRGKLHTITLDVSEKWRGGEVW